MIMAELQHPPTITLTALLHALGDPTRLHIARALFAADRPLTCQEAVKDITNLPVSTRSHCYKILREGGVIRAEKQGRACYNTLRRAEIEAQWPGLLATLLS